MTFEECARCGKHLHEGAIRYVIRLTVVGDDGGMVEEIDDPDSMIEELLRHIEQTDPYELENGVFEERIFLLCPECKGEYLRSPFGHTKRWLFEDDEIVGPIQ